MAQDKQVFVKAPCPTLAQDKEGMKKLEEYLELKAEATVGKKAVVHCTGQSEPIASYRGVATCKGAAQIASGFKECPYACLGLGDCVVVCPTGAIAIDPEKCNYQAARDIPGRKRCADGCIHCKICVKVSPNGEVTWNEEKDLPYFDPEKSLPAPAAIEKCPRKIIKKTAAYPKDE
jgi:ferredoxin